jgi:hypothetical protein
MLLSEARCGSPADSETSMSDIIEESDDAAAAAISYTNEFFDAAVAKIDGAFGEGHARSNPALIGALVQASAANLSAFMMAATASAPDLMDYLDHLPPDAYVTPEKSTGKRKK